MSNDFDIFIDRRKFLLVGVLVAAGCGGSDDGVQTVTTPPVKGGNRQRLELAPSAKSEADATKKKD
jgi:hypothetical protein